MDIAGFALAVLLIELTPGPNMAWLAALTLSQGRAAGLSAIGGVALGLMANALIAALGASFILTNSPWLASVMGYAGAAMMLYLAWGALRESGETSPAAVPTKPNGGHFGAGFAINLLNPKAALFFLTVAPQFVPGRAPTPFQAVVLAIVSVSIATLIHFSLVAGAARVRPLLLAPERATILRRAMAVLMVGVAAWFVAGALR